MKRRHHHPTCVCDPRTATGQAHGAVPADLHADELKRSYKAVAIGAGATGTMAVGSILISAIAIGAVAIGAVAIGALAIKRLSVRRGRFERLEID